MLTPFQPRHPGGRRTTGEIFSERNMNYGFSYKGSKNVLAARIVDAMPAAENFYDLFCGGCAVTHRALIVGKYQRYVINDLNPQCPQLFVDAIAGKYANEKRWISRDDFFRLKDTDAYVCFCWSFSNNGRDYLFGRDIEEHKKQLWEQRMQGGPRNGEHVQSAEALQRLQRLQRLQSLERLQRLQSLERFTGSYDAVPIAQDSVIYCDIPYRATNGYDSTSSTKETLDYDAFYHWALTRDCPVFISSYEMPQEFVAVQKWQHYSGITGKGSTATTEKLFIPAHYTEKYRDWLTTKEAPLFAEINHA